MVDVRRSPSFKPVKVSLVYIFTMDSPTYEVYIVFTEIVLHQPSGLLYAACSTPLKRTFWLPAFDFLDVSARLDQEDDYIAMYDFSTSTVSRLSLSGFEDPRGLFVHGFDVIPSSTDPNQLFVYIINHRPPIDDDPSIVGPDSVIEIFATTVGGTILNHLATVRHPVLETPNDVLGLPDGQSFYFTNAHGSKTGLVSNIVFASRIILS